MVKIRLAAAFLACGMCAAVAPSQTFLPQPRQVPQVQPAQPAAPANPAPPRLEAIAETRLLMEALTKPNFDGLGKHFADKPANAETWTYARGQALVIAETGNLLMMRPPRGKPAQEAWMAAATELRMTAAQLARAAGEKDYPTATATLATLANTCNRCHEKFGEKTRVAPFGQQ
jgi:hypothetical protein